MKRLLGVGAAVVITSLLCTSPARGQSPDSVSFHFSEADLRLVLAALAEAGLLNVTYSEIPQRLVTLRTNTPIPRSQVKGLLTSVAEANGLTVMLDSSVIRIGTASPATARNPVPQAPVELFVYRLKHANALALSSTLQAMYGNTTVDRSSGALSRTGLNDELRSQQILPVDPTVPPPPGARRPDQERVISGALTSAVHVVPEEATNSLLIRASSSDWEIIRQVIDALDLRPLQVMIEVVIAEVRRVGELNVGVSVTVPQQHEPRTEAQIGGGLAGATGGDLTLRVMNLGKVGADVILSALSTRGEVNIVSRPVVLAQNNEEARLLIGSQRPFIQVFRSLPTDAAVRDQVVQYRDVGTSLTLRPTINLEGYVSIDLIQEVSTATNEIQFGAPIISTREAATRLIVRDSQTVVIGGLIDRQEDRTRSGIPILKDIPLLGFLFGSTKRQSVQSELMLLLTPRIIYTDEDADRLRDDMERAARLQGRVPKQPPSVPDTASHKL